MTNLFLPTIPEYITVHLGRPDSPAPNVTVPFADYIKNVASSEIYPTWPDAAIRANILAQISFALNRVYTEYYRSRGYDFDITNSTANDQSFVNGRDIFENISNTVDEIFSSYISRRGSVEPLFAAYCDGDRVQCRGLSQWGSVGLANRGLSAYDIIRYYYGDDAELVTNAPVGGAGESYPGRVLRIGRAGNDVLFIQNRLNRISENYPAIPKIRNPDGVYNTETENAVRAFQKIFSLTQDGVVGRATWYSILRIYSAVKRLADVESEGISVDEIPDRFGQSLSIGSTEEGVRELQYLLRAVSGFVDTIPEIAVDGIFGPRTDEAVRAFQQTYGIPVTGIVDVQTWETLVRAYIGIRDALPEGYGGAVEPYPGYPISRGQEGSEVRNIQIYLNRISEEYPSIPKLTVDGSYGQATERAVRAYQQEFGIPVNGVVNAVTWDSIIMTYSALINGTNPA